MYVWSLRAYGIFNRHGLRQIAVNNVLTQVSAGLAKIRVEIRIYRCLIRGIP